jgi:hypothetical protein
LTCVAPKPIISCAFKFANSNYQFKPTPHNDTCGATFGKFLKRWLGVATCLMTTVDNVEVVGKINILESKVERKLMIVGSEKKELKAGDNVTFTCIDSAAVQDESLYWALGDRELGVGSTFPQCCSKTIRKSQVSLILKPNHHGKVLTCFLKNTKTLKHVGSQTTSQLFVNFKPEVIAETISQIHGGKTITIAGKANPKPAIEWFLVVDNLFETSGKYGSIENVQVDGVHFKTSIRIGLNEAISKVGVNITNSFGSTIHTIEDI